MITVNVPATPPKFNVGDHVIPISIDREEYPEGYEVGLIALSPYDDAINWVYWGMHEERHVDGWILTPGFAEQHLELYKESK